MADLVIERCLPSERAGEIQALFCRAGHPEFATVYERVYRVRERLGLRSWLGRLEDRVVLHISVSLESFTDGTRTLSCGLLADLMADESHRDFWGPIKLARRMVGDLRKDRTADFLLTSYLPVAEGNVQRMGIRKMDVQSIFRGGVDSYDYKDIKLDTQLQAQDLIGALDDAINYVSEENLKVGNFQNNMTRTLDLARQQQTSITGALSNLNDADMAAEATNQSKRSILVQSGTAMVAQANTQGQFLLQLLR
jgi:hypothetical protein